MTDPSASPPAERTHPSERYHAYGALGTSEAQVTDTTIALLDRLIGFDQDPCLAPDDKAHAPTRKHQGICRVCGQTSTTSFEHFPPATMGNTTKVRKAPAHAALEEEDQLAFPRAASYQIQKGAGAEVLCGSCNSHSGLNFVPAMAAFAEVVKSQVDQHIAMNGTAPGVLGLSLDEWELGSIARAGLVSVMAQGVHGHLLRAYPALTDVVRHGATGLPAGLRLGLTYAVTGRVRATPPHACLSPLGESVFMEMSAPPLAWTLNFMGEGRVALERTVDVTRWVDTPPGQLAPSTTLELPVGAVDSPLAGDFRPASLIRAEMEAAARRG